jgi:predicted RNA-binding Zn-ribbon protein involved in translation (DUF1610 family)
MKCPQCGGRNVSKLEEDDLTEYWQCGDCGWEGRG